MSNFTDIKGKVSTEIIIFFFFFFFARSGQITGPEGGSYARRSCLALALGARAAVTSIHAVGSCFLKGKSGNFDRSVLSAIAEFLNYLFSFGFISARCRRFIFFQIFWNFFWGRKKGEKVTFLLKIDENHDFASNFFIIFSFIFRKFRVSGASLERVLPVREERIEKFIDTIENEWFQNRDFRGVGFGQFW